MGGAPVEGSRLGTRAGEADVARDRVLRGAGIRGAAAGCCARGDAGLRGALRQRQGEAAAPGRDARDRAVGRWDGAGAGAGGPRLNLVAGACEPVHRGRACLARDSGWPNGEDPGGPPGRQDVLRARVPQEHRAVHGRGAGPVGVACPRRLPADVLGAALRPSRGAEGRASAHSRREAARRLGGLVPGTAWLRLAEAASLRRLGREAEVRQPLLGAVLHHRGEYACDVARGRCHGARRPAGKHAHRARREGEGDPRQPTGRAQQR